jgi:hypothetical protein
MDAMLIKFQSASIPKMFMKESFSKVLPTLLRLRDSNDFIKHEVQLNGNANGSPDVRLPAASSVMNPRSSSCQHQ